VYRTIFHAIDDAVFLVDVTRTDDEWTFTFRRNNEAHQRQTGFDAATIRGKSPEALLGPEQAADVVENYRRCVERGEQIDYEETLELPAGTTHWQTTLSPLVEDGEVTQLVGIARNVTDRKRRERELRELTERLELAIDGANLGVWDWQMATDEVEFNDNWATMLGYSPEEIDADLDEWERRLHPADADAVQAALDEHVAGETEYYDTEHRLRTAQGDWKWIRDVGKVFERDENGEPIRAVGIHIDIDDRKRAEETLRAERDMFNQGPAVVFQRRHAAGWPVEYVSANVEDVLGYAPAAFESGEVTFSDVVHDDDFERVSRTVTADAEGDTGRVGQASYRMVTADGDVRWVLEYTKTVDDPADDATRLGYLVDVTERRDRGRELERYESIINAVSDVATVVEPDGTITYVSPSVRTVLGYDPDELIGTNGFDYQPRATAGDVETAIEAVIENPKESRTVQTEFRHSDGSWRWIESTIQNRLDDDVIEGLLVSSRDITERKEYEQRLESQRDNLDTLNQVLRHDIRNDLQLVTTYAGMLTDIDDDERRQYAEMVLESATHAVELTRTAREMADVMLSETDGRAPVGLSTTLEAEIDDIRATYPEAVVVVDDTLPRVSVLADEMLGSVFRNLLKNAVQHNDATPPEVTVSVTNCGETVTVRVADNGPGIPDRAKQAVFGKGETGLDSEGTGLGLYLVDELVDSYGGRVWAEDNDPEGAVLVVELPTMADDE
jgi:PAS domain S-box-containing protein